VPSGKSSQPLNGLLSEIKIFAERYQHDEMSHFYHGVQLGWEKLDEYYSLTDDSPAYMICRFHLSSPSIQVEMD